MAQAAKNLPTMQETQAKFLGREDPQKKGMANNFNILSWIIPWTEESSSLQSMGLQRLGTLLNEDLNTFAMSSLENVSLGLLTTF